MERVTVPKLDAGIGEGMLGQWRKREGDPVARGEPLVEFVTDKAAFDWEHYGSADWSPHYTGEEWAPVVQRMMVKENSFLQEEQIALRVYEYLRDDTLGVYDLEADPEGAIVVEVDELPEQAEGDEQAAEDESSGDSPDGSARESGAAEPPPAE